MSMTSTGIEERLRRVLAIHFDPELGAPYWIRRAKEFGFDPRTEINCVADLGKMGSMDPKNLPMYKLEEFLPRTLFDRKHELIVAQTGGTLGKPLWTTYLEREFREAFVDPFTVAASALGFPIGGTWLYVGPSGPHVIARAADAIARTSGSIAPFSVDFDSRWAQKLSAGSFAAKRYLQHVVDQALAVLNSQEITVLFSTPVVLRALADAMDTKQRACICGVHYGGMAIQPEDLEEMQSDIFPNAVHLCGYGNTLFGCCLELSAMVGRELSYYPYGDRILFGVFEENGENTGRPIYDRAGVHGDLVFSRLDETILLINVLERDHVQLCKPPADAPKEFRHMGVASPVPHVEYRNVSAVSLY
ncbi:MAG: long-chain fatty acid--CoA ligase [Planctomycetes bacterium]|nr:long-chain fatty acid--CoA ligase [Planctomycetota bacterium]